MCLIQKYVKFLNSPILFIMNSNLTQGLIPDCFKDATEDQISKFISSSPIKSCKTYLANILDPEISKISHQTHYLIYYQFNILSIQYIINSIYYQFKPYTEGCSILFQMCLGTAAHQNSLSKLHCKITDLLPIWTLFQKCWRGLFATSSYTTVINNSLAGDAQWKHIEVSKLYAGC